MSTQCGPATILSIRNKAGKKKKKDKNPYSYGTNITNMVAGGRGWSSVKER